MKKAKKLTSLFLALIFAFSLTATTALAAAGGHTAQPNGPYCPNCNCPLTKKTETTAWIVESVNPCVHFLYGNDTKEYRMVTEYWVCSICHMVSQPRTWKQTRDRCHGTNTYPGNS